MALPNGVLVHGPASWACAIRNDDGRIEVASAYKTFRATRVTAPFLRGPARLAESLAILPQVKRALPAAKLPMQSPRMLASMVDGGSRRAQRPRLASVCGPPRRSCSPGSCRSRRPCSRCAASDLAAYHGAEHISIGRYEHGEARDEGARALRRASRRAARRDDRRRQRPRELRAAPRRGTTRARLRSSAPSPRRPRSSAG